MRAAVCHEFGKPLVVEQVDLDPPHAGEVKVELAACAICHTDIYAIEGAWGGPLPVIYGHEAAGVVEEVGPGVTLVEVGQRVVVTLLRSCGRCYFCSQGLPAQCETTFPLHERSPLTTRDEISIFQGFRTAAFAEQVVVDQSQLVAIPDDIAFESASLLACGVITGLGAVTNTAKVPAGSSVVVIGVGGVGLNSVQGARLSEAHPIIAIDLVDTKLEAAQAFGATHRVNGGDAAAAEVVRSLTAGRGADYVFVTVGSASAFEQGLKLLRRGGTLVVVGMPATGEMSEIEMGNVADAGQTIVGSKMGSVQIQVDVPKLVRLYQQGELKLDELVTGRYPLEEINEAIAAVNRGDALRNVILF